MNIARQAGVEYVLDVAVERIGVQGERARAVVLEDGSRHEAHVIVANADLPYVYQQLLPDSRQAERLAHKCYSCSVISFFWGVDKVYPALGPHTLFLADDYRANFDSIGRLALPDNPSLYIHAPVRLDPGAAPEGEDTLIAIVPVGHESDTDQQDWRGIRERTRQAVFAHLATLGITDLEAHLKFEVNFTPPSWHQRYNLMKSSTHGLAHTLTQLAYLRPRNRHSRYQNLYFVGASTHPGTGMPTALICARQVADRIVDDFSL